MERVGETGNQQSYRFIASSRKASKILVGRQKRSSDPNVFFARKKIIRSRVQAVTWKHVAFKSR